MSGVVCPDCGRGTIEEYDRCDECGLSWDDLDAADGFLSAAAIWSLALAGCVASWLGIAYAARWALG